MFRKKINTYIFKTQNKFMITDTFNVFEVNEVGARIFDLCNGDNKASDMSQKLAKKYNISEEIVKNDVDEYLKFLLDNNLIFVK
jgi:hypothetical protein